MPTAGCRGRQRRRQKGLAPSRSRMGQTRRWRGSEAWDLRAIRLDLPSRLAHRSLGLPATLSRPHTCAPSRRPGCVLERHAIGSRPNSLSREHVRSSPRVNRGAARLLHSDEMCYDGPGTCRAARPIANSPARLTRPSAFFWLVRAPFYHANSFVTRWAMGAGTGKFVCYCRVSTGKQRGWPRH
jgi:hypothetical protein